MGVCSAQSRPERRNHRKGHTVPLQECPRETVYHAKLGYLSPRERSERRGSKVTWEEIEVPVCDIPNESGNGTVCLSLSKKAITDGHVYNETVVYGEGILIRGEPKWRCGV